MTTHSNKFEAPLVWYGTWNAPNGLRLTGYHVWDTDGSWAGVYQSPRKASLEADLLK